MWKVVPPSDSPDQCDAVAVVEDELCEPPAQEQRQEVVLPPARGGAAVVAVVEDDAVLGLRPQDDLEVVPEGRGVPQGEVRQVGGPVEEGNLLEQCSIVHSVWLVI